MRGAIEFADWILRKLKVRQYLNLREKNVLVNTPHRWLLRIGALFVLLLPVIILIHNVGFAPKVNVMAPVPSLIYPDMKAKPSQRLPSSILISSPRGMMLCWHLAWHVFIQFTMSIVLNLALRARRILSDFMSVCHR